MRRNLLTSLCATVLCAAGGVAADEPRRNVFDDPFVQLTRALPACPVPEGPLLTEAEAKAQAHGRIERGTSCFRAGRCRLPNSYLYDQEIMPRVQKAVDADGRFDRTTSVWAWGQRRWIWLQGCVSSDAESQALESLVRGIDDVEGVVNELGAPTASPRPAPKGARAADRQSRIHARHLEGPGCAGPKGRCSAKGVG